MSLPIMPTLPLSMQKGLKKSPSFNSVVQKTAAKRGNSGISLTPYPCWSFEFSLDAITGNEAVVSSTLASFMGAFMATNGGAGLFLFTDPQDSTASYANSGMLNVTPGAATPMGSTGDGTSKVFQLARSIGVAWDIIQNLNGSITVRVNGSVVTPASVSSLGVVTFTTAPAGGATLTWAGTFYFACRFSSDSVESVRSFTINSGIDQWNISGVTFESEFQ
jgi:uncharacterized protein (TIGR02217 family)